MVNSAAPKLLVSRRIRATPYTPRVEALGVSGYTVVNHTILPKGFRRTVVEDYWHLKTHVQLWDVGCQRQVELHGTDAAKLMQLLTPRDLSNAYVGQCLYAPIIDEKAGMLNDPIILKLADDRYWMSIADSDILLWAKGLAVGMNLDVEIEEPDVWPLAVQGPKSDDVVAKVFGDSIRDIRFFQFKTLPFNEHPLVVARTGYSKQGGFEIYLDQPSLGLTLWDALWEAGEEFDITPGCPNLIERVEGGLLSYGNDMTRENNPFECRLDSYCQLDGSIDFIGRSALQRIAENGPEQLVCGVLFDGEACPACQHPWPVLVEGRHAGQMTTAIWSPSHQANVGLAMIKVAHATEGQAVSVQLDEREIRQGKVTSLPFPQAMVSLQY